ncbi:MAG: DNA primase [Candidatus Aminicenantes bacterium]|nr:DNA primase [Candidatus Aminicenantes bacterium]
MEVIDQIKQAASIVAIASQYTTLRLRGKKHIGLCPFHSEKSPSFTVDEEKQLFHCFGCGIGGDIFTLVMEKENLSFPEALRYLADKFNIKLPEKKSFSPQMQKLEEQLYTISEDALAHFRKNLFNTKEGEKAQEYLHKRKISDETIQKLKIGYAPNSWDSLLNAFQRKKITPGLLEKAGLVLRRTSKEGFYDRFRGRIIFPIFTISGKVVAFGGRSIIGQDPKYLNSPDTPIYTKGNLLYGLNFSKEAIRERSAVILVEGYTDFLALYQAGIENVAASLGTSLTTEQVVLARRFAAKVMACYDADAAGLKAATRAVAICFEQGIGIEITELPKDFDPDSFIQKFGPKKFQEFLEKSISGLRFLINSQAQGKNLDSPEVKSKAAKNIVELIDHIPDPVVRSEYLKKTSEYLAIDEKILRSMIQIKKPEKESEARYSFLNAEKRLLQILFEDSGIAPVVFQAMKDEDFKGLKSEPIFKILSDFFNNGKEPDFQVLRENIGKDLFSTLSQILQEKEQTPSSSEALACVMALRQFSLENQSRVLKFEIQKLEKAKETKKVMTVMRRLQEVKMQLSELSSQNLQE